MAKHNEVTKALAEAVLHDPTEWYDSVKLICRHCAVIFKPEDVSTVKHADDCPVKLAKEVLDEDT